MRTTRWMVIVAMVVTTAAWACESDGDATDVVVQDTADVQAPQDVPGDPGQPEDNGPLDTGKDTAKPDTTPVDNGPKDTPPTDVPPTCPLVVTGPTCSEIGACAIQCADAAHETACVGATTGAELDKWTALKACLATAACPKVWENEQFTACATGACQALLEGCFQGADKKCRDIWICRKDCDADDPSCPARCLGSGTVPEQAKFVAYKTCILGVECAETDIMANGWPVWTCEEYGQYHNCPLQSQDCFPPT